MRPEWLGPEWLGPEWLGPEWLGAAAGVLLMLVAIGWRQVHRHRVRSQVNRALSDPDPVRRRAAVGVATEHGLRTYARLLAARIDAETHPAVRAALVDGVLRTPWEPADRSSILRLRLWAYEERARAHIPPAPAPVPAPRPAHQMAPPVAPPQPYRPPVPAQGRPRHRAPVPARFPLVAGGH